MARRDDSNRFAISVAVANRTGSGPIWSLVTFVLGALLGFWLGLHERSSA
jgi:hypothetical protein